MGDLNINILPHEKTTKPEKKFENLIPENGMKQMNTLPTRVQGSSSSCIDHIILRSKNFDTEVTGTVDMDITDHRAIFIILKNQQKNEEIIFEIKKFDYKKIEEKFKTTSWDFITKNHDVNTNAANLIDFIKNIKEENSTILKQQVKKKKTFINKPWVTSKIKQLINKRNKLRELTLEYPNNIKILEIYKILRNKIIALIKLTKNRYYRNGIENAQGNNRKLWNVINDISNRNKKKAKTLPDLEDNLKTANEMGNFFSKVGKDDNGDNYTYNFNSNRNNEMEFLINPVEEQEIKNIIKELKSTNSKGADDIEMRFIKKFANYLAVPIKHIINCSFEDGVFPECLKTSIIVPIFKQGNRNEFTNYRPITITSNISKIMETTFLNRLQFYLNKNNIINNSQFGFRRGMGTDDALGELFKKIYNNINDSIHTTATFIDLTKAFDKVDHRILLHKLDRYGVKNKEKNWCGSFLKNRTISTKIDKTIGTPQIINWGVPQGSILGPVLFLIYINDIYEINLKGKIINYADDCVIINGSKNLKQLSQEASKDINNFNSWCNDNRLRINSKKTKFIYFSLTDKKQNIDIKLHTDDCTNAFCDCEKIVQTNSIKYLGIHVDEHLKWNIHIDKLYNYLKVMCYNFYHIRNYFDMKTCLMFYYAMIFSHINYGIHIWGATYNIYINKLNKIQKKIFKIMFKNDYKKNKNTILNIKQAYMMKNIIYHRRHNSENNTSYNLRNKNIQTNGPKKEKYRQSFEYVYSRIFTYIPDFILEENNLKKMKQETKKWILEEGDLQNKIDLYKD